MRLSLVVLVACNSSVVGAPVEGDRVAEGTPESRACRASDDPGRLTLRRLNRSEYNNTVRDLLGTATRPADDFPADDIGAGFDNQGAVLALSPLLFEKLQATAAELARSAVGAPASPVTRGEAEQLTGTAGAAAGEFWNLNSNGSITLTHEVTRPGRYRLSARAYQREAGTEPARMTFAIDGAVIDTLDVTALAAAPAVFAREADLAAGARQFRVAFINDYYEPNVADRNLYVDWLEIEGPLGAPSPAGLVTCDPAVMGEMPCARDVIASFGARAWRRPLASDEIDRLTAFVTLARAEGDPWIVGLELAVEAILSSPHFIYRVEVNGDASAPRPVTGFELASRLSYFLWSSMPDGELFEAADSGRLHEPEQLRMQVERMLEDARALALTENFAGQWLLLRELASVDPNAQLFPDFDDDLRVAMRRESELFFADMLARDAPLDRLVVADFTYLNDRLARHYGLPATGGDEMVRVDLSASVAAAGGRGGLLAHGSLLTVSSHPNRTSPVKRGKLLLEQILCTPPAPPPPGVEGLPDEVDTSLPLREQMQQHRSDPTCASCHSTLDPLGFALENFDAVGAWRDRDAGGFPIDAAGELPDGRRFDGHEELASIIGDDPQLSRCVSEQMLTYALGRELGNADQCTLETLSAGLQGGDEGLRTLVHRIAASTQFRMRRAEVEP